MKIQLNTYKNYLDEIFSELFSVPLDECTNKILNYIKLLVI